MKNPKDCDHKNVENRKTFSSAQGTVVVTKLCKDCGMKLPAGDSNG